MSGMHTDPDRIGRYQVLGVLGKGGMGTVYRAQDPDGGRMVAIKCLHSHFRQDAAVLDRFRAEARIQAQLVHPHVVKVLDFVEDEQAIGIVMEYVDGLPVDQLIVRQGGGLPLGQVMAITFQVLSALEKAHGLELVHRDLKPSNILVTRSDAGLVAKVTDFAVARVLGSEELKAATAMKPGTLAYMSPEQLQNPREVDARSDIYALGVMMYEMITGVRPFEADTDDLLMRKIMEEAPPRLSGLLSNIDPGLESLVWKAMAKRPEHRFPSIRAFRHALERATSWHTAAPPPPIAAWQEDKDRHRGNLFPLPCPEGQGNPPALRGSQVVGDLGANAVPGELPLSHAGFWLRGSALLLDGVILVPVFFLAALLFWRLRVPPLVLIGLGSYLALTMYYALFEISTWQGTPGKRIMNIHVTDELGRRVDFRRAFMRNLLKLLSLVLLGGGYLMAAMTDKGQALHDSLVHCLVVRRVRL